MITKSILNEMKNSDIKSCNKADLIDIRTIEIDKNSSINTLYNKKGNLLIVIFCLILLFFGFISVGHKG